MGCHESVEKELALNNKVPDKRGQSRRSTVTAFPPPPSEPTTTNPNTNKDNSNTIAPHSLADSPHPTSPSVGIIELFPVPGTDEQPPARLQRHTPDDDDNAANEKEQSRVAYILATQRQKKIQRGGGILPMATQGVNDLDWYRKLLHSVACQVGEDPQELFAPDGEEEAGEVEALFHSPPPLVVVSLKDSSTTTASSLCDGNAEAPTPILRKTSSYDDCFESSGSSRGARSSPLRSARFPNMASADGRCPLVAETTLNTSTPRSANSGPVVSFSGL